MTINGLVRRVAAGVLMAVGMLAVSIGTSAQQAQEAHSGRIEAFETNYWRFWALAGDEIMVIVEGDGDTDLDCQAHDRDGQVLAADTDETDYCLLRFTAPQSGFVQVRIDNLGDVWNAYELRVGSAPRPASALPGHRLA